MPELDQVRRRYKPTCYECRAAQSPRDSFICTFADLIRYPPLQSTPAKVPRLITAPDPTPPSPLPPNNRARAAERRAHARSIRIRIAPYSSSSPRITIHAPDSGDSVPLPPLHHGDVVPSPPRSPPRTRFHYKNILWIGEYEKRNGVDPSLWDTSLPPPSPDADKANTKDRGKQKSDKKSGAIEKRKGGRKGKTQAAHSLKGKERARFATPDISADNLPAEVFDEDDVGAQMSFIDSIAPPPPPRIPSIGEAGPSRLPLPSHPALSSSPSFSSHFPIPLHTPVPADDEEELEVLQMLLDE